MGLEEEHDGEEEVTQALDRERLNAAHPADADGPTRMVGGEAVLPRAALPSELDLSGIPVAADEATPADGEGPTRIVPADAEEAQTAHPVSIQSDPPPAEKTRALPRAGLIGDDEVPVTEGTALISRPQILGARTGEANVAPLPLPQSARVETGVVATPPASPAEKGAPSPRGARGGWGRPAILFIVTFVLTGVALLYAWYTYVW